MKFDLKTMVKWIKEINPIFVSIGADSKTQGTLPEPTASEIHELVKELSDYTEVIQKPNLRRIYKQEEFL